MKRKYVKPEAKICLPDCDLHLLAGSNNDEPETFKVEYTDEFADLDKDIL